MTEASVTQALHLVLKTRLPNYEVTKIADRATIGRPDSCVTGNGRTTWLEIKLLRKGDSIEKCSKPIQLHTMKRLQVLSGGRAWYVVYDLRDPKAKRLLIFQPIELLNERPDIWCEGFDHGVVADLIQETHV